VPTVAEGARANHFASVRIAVISGAKYLNFAGLTHCQRIFQQERDTAYRRIAGGHFMGCIRQSSVQDSQFGLSLDWPAIVPAAVDCACTHR
jgi:hypothetical protein